MVEVFADIHYGVAQHLPGNDGLRVRTSAWPPTCTNHASATFATRNLGACDVPRSSDA